MARSHLSLLAPLRDAYEASRAVRTFADLQEICGQITGLVTEDLGWERAVVHGHRQAWDHFEVLACAGPGTDGLLGTTRCWTEWAPYLSAGQDERGACLDSAAGRLVVTMRDADGELNGLLTAEGPPRGGPPAPEDVDAVVAIAHIAGAAMDEGRNAARRAVHQDALEHLLAVSATLADARSAATVLDAVCKGIRDALGFERVVVELADARGALAPAAHVGWDAAPQQPLTLQEMAKLFTPEHEEHGCYLLERPDALRILGVDRPVYASERNGSGPWAWRRHWLLVPLRDPAGHLIGFIWPDDPTDCLRPDTPCLQALRLFADQAQAALEAARHYEQAVHMARHDSLTGLPNRRVLLDRLQHALLGARRRSSTVAVLFIDLDRYKAVNDTHGHDVGDEVLRIAGARIDESLRPGDTVARLGGDEFVALCEDVRDGTEAIDISRRLRAALSRPMRIGGATVELTASVGIALPAGETDDASTLLRDADVAMYRAKEAGRDGEALSSPAMRAGASARVQLERALGGALVRDEIRLHWQPIVSVGEERIVRLEALSRWDHPGLGWVSPLEFIPIAEETGFIVELGRWVLQESCAQWAAWRDRYGDQTPGIAVNLSPRQLNDPQLLDLVSNLIVVHRMPAGALCVEITEGVLLEAGPATEHALAGLRSLGVELDLDDFGTGFSSLSSLERFHVDGLKIDRGFVSGRERDERAGAIVEALLLMARAMGVRATAEGVETAEQLAWLADAGCEHAQGYHFARPQPADQIDALLAARLPATA